MPGVVPKHPALRQRMNKTSTAATLPADEPSVEGEIPTLLPERRRWHAMTKRWWENLWQSPMRGEYVTADTDRLYMLALLVDQFWKRPSTALATEIRLQGQCFGLTPIDRRRLQWALTDAPPPADSPPTPAAARPDGGPDPRTLLRVV